MAGIQRTKTSVEYSLFRKFQARVPIGKFILELPAGMLDDEKGDFVGTAVREVSFFFSPYAQQYIH
jgi:hypothetical protein